MYRIPNTTVPACDPPDNPYVTRLVIASSMDQYYASTSAGPVWYHDERQEYDTHRYVPPEMPNLTAPTGREVMRHLLGED